MSIGLLNSPLLLGLRTFMTPLEAAKALHGTQAPDAQISPILLQTLPLLRAGGAIPQGFTDQEGVSDRRAVVDVFRKIEVEKWQEILRPDPEAIFKRVQEFQPRRDISEILIKEHRSRREVRRVAKPDTQTGKKGERWIVYDRNLLFNPESGEILKVSEQDGARELSRKLRGKKMGSILDAAILPPKIKSFTLAHSPYILNDDPDFGMLAYTAKYYLRTRSDDNMVLYYGGEQWRVTDFCVTGALILCNANASARSGFPEDYLILDPGYELEPYYFRPFVPAVLTRSNRIPWNHSTHDPNSSPNEFLRVILGGRNSSSLTSLFVERPMTSRRIAELIELPESSQDTGDTSIPTIFAAVFTTLRTIPDSLLAGLTKIRIVDEAGPNQEAANAWKGVITFFGKSAVSSEDRAELDSFTRGAFYHELGHHIAGYRFGNSDMKNHCGWLKAMQADANSPCQYAKNTRAEDFAETVRLYFLRRGGLEGDARERHPNRFAFLDELFWDVLTPAAKRKIGALKRRLSKT